MSSEDSTLTAPNGDGEQPTTRSRDGSDGTTPKSELPPRTDATTPTNVAARTVRRTAPSSDYFTSQPAADEQYAQMVQAHMSPPSPSISSSDVTAQGHFEVPETIAGLHVDRPQPYTSLSSTSVQTVSSVATVTAASSAPALPTVGQPRPPYPNQSYAALHHQQYPAPHPPPLLKQRSAHPGQIATFASAFASSHQSGSRTVGNSPAGTPGTNNGLFTPQAVAPPSEWDTPTTPGTYASPFLHFTQRVPPKETHVADVDVDPISGRKLINHYEIIDELGRGTHGKVKLGRDLNTDGYVAIKIVERFSRRRKLGKLGTTEDKVKKEVAILKQARHPNVVALLEVIDDPSRKKVYIVLEWVERGEIQWRTKGPKEIAMVESRRYDRERAGNKDPHRQALDAAVLNEAQRRLMRQRRRQHRALRKMRRDISDDPEAWSNELAGDELSDMSDDDRLSRVSTESYSNRLVVDMARRASRTPSPLPPTAEVPEVPTPTPETHSHVPAFMSEPLTLSPTTSKRDFGEQTFTGLEGTMYGAYIPSSNEQSRSSSIAHSLHSAGSASKSWSTDSLQQEAINILDNPMDIDLEYVPMMTIHQTRIAFRDTLLGLQYLHYQGIVHRDIKPPNLLATKDHRVKISDFGVSYLGKPIVEGDTGEGVSEHDTQDLADEAKELAKTVGTPAFYAPELCISDGTEGPLPVTKAIDVWALGITLFCMLFARTPFVDNEFVVMRQIAEEDIYIPWQRLKPVDTKSRSRPSSHGRASVPLPSTKRHELELVYEDIGEDLHDLLKRLLTKDPRKRITLDEVRHHPWVVADLTDKVEWLEATDMNREDSGGKIKVSKEDVSAAVVPLQFIDRVRSGIKKVGERLGFGGGPSKTNGRGRAQSTVTTVVAGGVSPSPSNASSTATSRDSRRQSLRGDESASIMSALKSTREGEHPLSKSVAASPEADRQGPYFDDAVPRPESAFGSIEDAEQIAIPRPGPPERATTVMATGNAMRTVRQSDMRRSRHEESPPPSPGLPGTPTAIETAAGVLGSGWGSGMARRILKTVRERSTARSTSSDRGSIGSIDTHGEPSLAVSQMNAAGVVGPAFDDLPPPSVPSSAQNSPSVSRPMSLFSSPSRERLSPHVGEPGSLSRTSSTGSISSLGRLAITASLRSPVLYKQVPQASTAAEWQRATDEHVRKLIIENEEVEEHSNVFDDRTCPPSPDDQRPSRMTESRRISEVDIFDTHSRTEPSPTSQDSQLPPPTLSSTSDLGSTSAVSASISNPSIPSVISRASSVDPRDAMGPPDIEQKSELMSSGETLNPRTRFEEEAQDDGYTADDNVLNSEDEADYDSSSDSDGGLVMSRRKSASKAASDIKERRLSARSKKSSRSGSTNTMKKVRTRDSEDERRRHEAENIAEG